MKLTLIVLSIMLCSCGLAQETNITEMASEAYKQFLLGDISNHTDTAVLTYKGWSGNERTFRCSYRATMTLTFKGADITGVFSYDDNKLTISVKGKEDVNGNIILKQILPDGNVNYVLKGKRDDWVIKGLWSKGGDKKQYAINVQLEKPKASAGASISSENGLVLNRNISAPTNPLPPQTNQLNNAKDAGSKP